LKPCESVTQIKRASATGVTLAGGLDAGSRNERGKKGEFRCRGRGSGRKSSKTLAGLRGESCPHRSQTRGARGGLSRNPCRKPGAEQPRNQKTGGGKKGEGDSAKDDQQSVISQSLKVGDKKEVPSSASREAFEVGGAKRRSEGGGDAFFDTI